MKSSLLWQSEEEGVLSVSEEKLDISFMVYRIGDEEAELSLQDIVFPDVMTEDCDICRILTSEMTKCLKETFRLLWDEGLEEVCIVEKKGSKYEEIIGSTCVVQKVYSEYMMKKKLQPAQDTTDGDEEELFLTKREDGLVAENRSRTFFCHLQSYKDGYYLFEVEVEEKFRNRGIATKCLQKLFEQLTENGQTVLYLQVGSYNEPAMHLYEKLGFEVSEELCYYGPAEEEER